MSAHSASIIFTPGSQMAPGGNYVIDSDMDFSALHPILDLPASASLTVVSGATLTVDSLTLAYGSRLHLDGGHLVCGSISLGQSASVGGRGTIMSRSGSLSSSTLTAGPGAILDFSDIEVNLGPDGTLTAGAGTTLRMANRRLTARTLSSPSGQSHIDAPERHVFDVKTFSGQWHSDRAFAQWFIEPTGDDWANAINNALTVDTEAVYLPGRLCRISKTIKMPVKSRLIGTTRGLTKIHNGEKIVDYYGTLIAPTANASLTLGLFICLNIKDNFFSGVSESNYYNYIQTTENEAWPEIDHFPPSGAEVADIRFFGNKFTYNQSGGYYTLGSQIDHLRGIFVAGAAKFKNLIFRSFEQAIAWSRDYADCKHLERCYIQEVRGKENKSTTPYALDLQNLGDAAIIDGCHIDPTNAKGLRLSLCGGARITNNILNADILIQGCKGIIYTGNHSESGPQLSIINSSMEVTANYFEKGERPSIQVGSTSQSNSSVVTLSNNVYAYFTKRERPSCLYPWKVDKNNNIVHNYIDIKEVSEYDIEVSSPAGIANTLAAININNEMRYYIPPGGYSAVITTGIAIRRHWSKKEVINNKEIIVDKYDDIKEFNKRSQFLSRDAKITVLWEDANHVQYPSFTYKKLANPVLGNGFISEGQWYYPENMEPGMNLKYSYQFIYDYSREIAGREYSNTFTFTAPEYRKDPETNLTIVGESNHVIGFNLNNADVAAGKQIMVRVLRKWTVGEGETVQNADYVDIPLCVALNFIDVGVSVNGYKWKKAYKVTDPQTGKETYYDSDKEKERKEIFVSPLSGIDDVEFRNDNVVVWSTSKITNTSGWKRGDIIYNVGSDTSWTQQIIK